MAHQPSKRPLAILYLLGIYIILQFIWWAYLLIDANEERLAMVIGEGAIFFFLLLYGLYRLKRSFDREIALADQERNFMMAVTHELRSPIASIKLFLQTLRRMNEEDAEQKRMADRAIAETDRLNGLVDNILLASRLESDAFSLSFQEADLGEQVRASLEVTVKTIGAGHRTEFDIEEGIRARVDPEALRSILVNLYENAVKYSPPDSRILVQVYRADQRGRIRIVDEGKGISDLEKGRVVQKFYRAEEEAERSSKGTGLGLYIVQRLIRLQGAELRIEDAPEGGTVVELSFPKL